MFAWTTYNQTSNIRGKLLGDEIVDHSDDAVGAAQIHLYSLLNTWLKWIRQRQLQDGMWCVSYLGFDVNQRSSVIPGGRMYVTQAIRW